MLSGEMKAEEERNLRGQKKKNNTVSPVAYKRKHLSVCSDKKKSIYYLLIFFGA